MVDKDEALKLALEALEQHGTPFLHHEDAYSNSLNALRQAIADAEKQEPVAWMREDEDCTDCIVWEQTEEHTIPLYTSPPQRKPLTDEQIDEIYFKSSLEVANRCDDIYDFARAIEAAHGIKGE